MRIPDMLRRAAPRALAAALLLVPLVTTAEEEDHAGHKARENVGKVHFAISCSPAAQEHFDRAVAMLHSFFYPETVKAFTAIAETEPACAMAWWGIAISQMPNPLVPPFDPAALK